MTGVQTCALPICKAERKEAAPSPAVVKKPIQNYSRHDFKTFRIRFKPSPDAYRRGVKPESLIRELRELGETSVRCDVSDVPPLSRLDPETSKLAWNVLLTTSLPRQAIDDVFIFEEGTSDLTVEEIDHDDVIDGDEVRKLGEILASRRLPDGTIDDALARQRPIGEILVKDLEIGRASCRERV